MDLRFIDTKKMEQIYGLSLSFQQKLRRERKIDYIKIGTKVLYSVEIIEAWLKKHSLGVSSEEF